MKETIYTIPVNEAFEKPCECPMCNLENRFENDRVNYYLGPSLMEPENRIETNETGFCAKHFKQMYDTRANRLGLGLILHTHLTNRIRGWTGWRTAPRRRTRSPPRNRSLLP